MSDSKYTGILSVLSSIKTVPRVVQKPFHEPLWIKFCADLPAVLLPFKCFSCLSKSSVRLSDRNQREYIYKCSSKIQQ